LKAAKAEEIPVANADQRPGWDRGGVLSSMRTRSGAPNLRVRLLAGLVALLLLGPAIVLVVFRLAAQLMGVLV
jgi:hypothetical protein